MPTWARRVQLAGALLLVLVAPMMLLASHVEAATLTSGPVTLTTIGTVTPNTPYSSGQTINITVAANSTLSLANLETYGFTGEPSIKVDECADPGGLVANLPVTPTDNCDGSTIDSTTAINSDGSLQLQGFTIYALPDSISLGESAGQVPACGIGNDECVLYIGPDQNDFSDPHLFSAPFSVKANSDDGGENPGDGSPLAPSQTSATNSTVTVSPTSVAADGVDTAEVTVTLEDTNGAPVTGGKQVTLSQGSGHSVIETNGMVGSTGTTDATTGVITFSVSDATSEAVTYTATDVTDSNLVLTPATPPTVTFVAPVVTPANSAISAAPTAVASGGTSTITVTLRDQGVPPQPIAGKVVALAASGGSSVITATSATTNAQGQATFSVTDSASEAVTYSATDTSDNLPITGQSVTVTFGTLSVSPTASTVTATPTVVSSASVGGVASATSTVTVTLLAPDGHSPVSGKTVSLSASSTNAKVASAGSSDVTGANGEATFTVSDATSENVVFTAKDTTDGITITPTATVDFEAPAPSATASTVTVSVPTDPADGVTPATIDVTVVDQFGSPVAGVTLSVAGNSTTTRVAAQTESSGVPAGTTDANGKAVFYAYDTTAETVTYTATDTTDNVVITQTASVTFDAGAPQVSNSTLAASPTNVAANGTASSTVTVTLEDHNNNPVAGKAVTLLAQGGSSVITPISPTTNAQGQATFGVTDSTSEVVTYTATDTTDNLPLVGQATTVTFGTPPPAVPTIADSTIVAEPTQVPADGSTTATITVVLADSNGNALSGKTVALNPSSGHSSVKTVTGVTDSDGQATFTVTDTTVEQVTYTATDVTDDLPLTGEIVVVSFVAPSGSTGTTTTTTTTPTTTTTIATTSTTTAGSGSSSASTTTVPAASTDASTGGSSTSSSTVDAGVGLALTGSPDLLPWVIVLGGLLLLVGSVGRRRFSDVTTPLEEQS